MSDRDAYMDESAYEGVYEEAEEDMEAANVNEYALGGDGRHTKFLDLTNGEGGELAAAALAGVGGGDESAAGMDQPENAYDEEEEEEPEPPVAIDPVEALMDAHIRAGAAARAAGGSRVDPNTPGKVVEAGQEHTGRWTKEEHEAFLSALQMYGKEWKKVAAKVKTRTVVQTRTHAQKYFQKLQKAMENSGKDDISRVDMGVAPEVKKVSIKKKRGAPSIASKPRPPTSNLTNAAQLISALAAGGSQNMQSSSEALATASFAAAASNAPMVAPSSLSRQQQQSHFPAARHGFSTGSENFRASSFSTVGTYGAIGGPDWSSGAKAMTIVAPDPEALNMRGKFPEPSPAACGKRKLAEIAAARMLAGVAAGGKPLLSSAMGDDVDGDATPPPASPVDRDKGVTLRDVPAPPLLGGHAVGAGVRKGLALQIVNPETFEGFEEKRRRGANGEGSPVTPWEGQLKALVSEKNVCGDEPISEMKKMIQWPDLNGGVDSSSHHAVCGPSSGYSRSPLHKAVCEMDLATIQRELSLIANDCEQTGILAQQDDAGYYPLHSASALRMLQLNNATVACEIVRSLITAGADSSCADNSGNTPLHWAARVGDKDVAEVLLLKNCPQDAQNHLGETPLHWAMRAGRTGKDVASVLLENGARPSVLNKDFKRPIDVAVDGFEDSPESQGPKRPMEKSIEKRKRLSKEEKRVLLEVTEERKEVRAHFLQRSAQSRTLVLHHPECLEHTPKSHTDWEAPDRITAIMEKVAPPVEQGDVTGKSVLFPYEVALSSDFDRAKLDLLSRVHSTDYLSFVNELSKQLERQQKEEAETEDFDSQKPGTLTPPVVPFTPMVQRSMIKLEEPSVKLGAHSDTSFSVGSLRAARRAAGAVQHAVDCVLVGRNRNAFCIVRPPGHHAGVNGLLDGGESCGFCLFNNVAAGALHAISDERLLCERCAIVDIDVHHGNGTEEIVKKCNDPGKLFFFSIHLYDNDKKKPSKAGAFQYKFYPGTGAEDVVAYNIINVALKPLWKEATTEEKPVAKHNTRQRTRQKIAASDSMDDSSDVGTPKEAKDGGRFSDADSETNSSTKEIPPAFPSPQAAQPATSSSTISGRLAYRQAIQNRLLPALRAFNPDLILISAGFDAARADVGNARHERGGERMGLDLEPEDYAWTTRKVCEIADICCHGRVVSVLEGGYGRSPAVGGHSLDRSNLADCAVRHLHALVDPYDAECRFSS